MIPDEDEFPMCHDVLSCGHRLNRGHPRYAVPLCLVRSGVELAFQRIQSVTTHLDMKLGPLQRWNTGGTGTHVLFWFAMSSADT